MTARNGEGEARHRPRPLKLADPHRLAQHTAKPLAEQRRGF